MNKLLLPLFFFEQFCYTSFIFINRVNRKCVWRKNMLLFLLTIYTGLFNLYATTGLQKNLVWTQPADHPNGQQQYAVFRKTFYLDDIATKGPEVEIFADSRYLLWINGKYVSRGPVRFNPKSPEYDVIPVENYLRKGQNVISVLVHSFGDRVCGRIMYHEPGLAVRLLNDGTPFLATDSTWRYSVHTRYLPSGWASNSFPDRIDARIDNEEWLKEGFDDSRWKAACGVSGESWGKFRKSEVPLCMEERIDNPIDLATGKCIQFPYRLKQGEELSLDLGAMSMAYTDMELTAPAGIKLNIRYTLRCKEGRPYETFGGGNNYVTRDGQQHFITTDQWCCRYAVLKIDSGEIEINRLAFVNRRYPYQRLGSFTCSDSFFNDLWEMSVHTIETVSDDAYGTDARERNEWIQDGHKASFSVSSVALSAPAFKGKTDVALLKSMLRHAALTQLKDGILLATFPTDRGPSDCHYIIEDYASQWIEALYHYYSITKDLDFVKEHKGVMVRLLNWFSARISERGLVYAREYASFDNPMAYVTCEGATLNAFYYEALKCAVKLADALDDTMLAKKYSKEAANLSKHYNAVFWNETEGAYGAAIVDNELLLPSVHAQLLALYTDLVPDDRKDRVRKWLLENYNNPGTKSICKNTQYRTMLQNKSGIDMPIIYYWLLKVLYDIDTPEMDSEILENVRRRWFYMVTLQKDAGTLSESFIHPDGTGSDESCHNYGTVPAYYLSSYVLGVRVEDDRLLIEPRLGNLTYARGKVVTPYGTVSADWQKGKTPASLSFNIELPKGVSGELRLPILQPGLTVVVNGRKVLDNGKLRKGVEGRIEGRWLLVNSVKGTVSGRIYE